MLEHEGAVTDAVFGPGGSLVATTSSDGATRLWNARTGAEVGSPMLGHTNAVNSVSFSPDGRYLLTVSIDGTARVWDAATARPGPQPVLRGHTDAVSEGSFAPDGSVVVTAGADDTARIWDPGTTPELRILAARAGLVSAAAFSPDGRLVLEAATTGPPESSTGAGRTIRTLRHPARRDECAIRQDGSLVFTADAARTIRAWRSDSGALLRAVPGVSAGPLAVSPDGRLMATPALQGGVRVLDGASLALVREFGQGGRFTAVAFSPDGRLLAAAGKDSKARIWDARTGALVRAFEGHTEALTDVEFSADGSRIVTSSRDPRRQDLGRQDRRLDSPARAFPGPSSARRSARTGNWSSRRPEHRRALGGR